MPWTLAYAPAVQKDLIGIDRQDQRFILDSLDKFARSYSPAFVVALRKTGRLKKLHGPWKGFHRLRLRTWRVIYKEYDERLLLLAVRVGHRREVYE